MSFSDDKDFLSLKHDIDRFFNSDSWHQFYMSLSNESTANNTDLLIPTLTREMRKGTINPSIIFKTNQVTKLVESFILNPDQSFLNIAFRLLINLNDNSPLPFIESLIERSPRTIINMISQTPTEVFTYFIRLLIFSYFRKPSSFLSKSLLKYSMKILIPQFFLDVTKYDSTKSTSSIDPHNIISLLLDFWKFSNEQHILHLFYSSVRTEISVAFDEQYDHIVLTVLDFIDSGYQQQLFEYSTVFGEIFGGSDSEYFVDILCDRMDQTENAIVQTQIELINPQVSKPLKDLLQSKMHKNETKTQRFRNFPDTELISAATQYQQKKTMPAFISQLHMFDKEVLINSVAPALIRLSTSNQACKEFVEFLENKKFIPVIKKTTNWETVISTLRDTDSTIGQFAQLSYKVPMNKFAPKFFDSFHKALNLRHSKDIKNFFKLISTQFISKLDDLTEFTKIVVEFLKSDLNKQHRKTLSIIALACPLHRFIESDIFDQDRELEIILNLHEAAIISCEYLTSDQNYETYFDPLLILRLRWRYLRGDSSSTICWNPEFVSLADNNIFYFMKWEATSTNPNSINKRMRILSLLGIVSSFSKVPMLIRELLSIEHPSSCFIETIVPFLKHCSLEKVVLPEKINLNTLFQIDTILWSDSVMNHPQVLELLRNNPDVSISQSLLISNGTTTQNFEKHPIGFYALLVNAEKLIGEKPPILDHIEQLLENIDYCNINNEIPYYAILSMVAYLSQRNRNLHRLFGVNQSFSKACVFFSTCEHKFDQLTRFLQSNPTTLKVLTNGIPECIPFVGNNCWQPSLIDFCFYCITNQIYFDFPDWIHFVSQIKDASWPQSYFENNSKLVLFNEYCKYHNI